MTWRDYLRAAWRDLPPGWRRLLVALAMAALGLVLLTFVLPPELQIWPVLALFALFVAVQAAILWRMWRQSPAVRRAQRLYLSGQFEEAARALEEDRLTHRQDVARDTLLGNVYRQLGRLPESETILSEAVEADPGAPYSAYGLGRTLLVMGHFDEAATWIARALRDGGQPTIAADLGYALYLAGKPEAAVQALERAAALELEPHRALMAAYLNWRCGDGAEAELLRRRLARYESGLAVWQAEAERFGHTPYGAALQTDMTAIQGLLEEEPL